MGSVSFSCRYRQCRHALRRNSGRCTWPHGGGRGGAQAGRPAIGAAGARCAKAGTRSPGPAITNRPTQQLWRCCASWRASTRAAGRRSAVRSAARCSITRQWPTLQCGQQVDLDGRHATHEGLRVLARLRVGLRHGQQLARQRQAFGLGRRGQQPVVTNALEAGGSTCCSKRATNCCPAWRSCACRRGVGAHAQAHLARPSMPTSRSLPMAVRWV